MRRAHEQLLLYGAIGVGLLLFGRRLLEWAGNLVNPFSEENIAYRGAGAIARWVSGDPSQTWGGLVYDVFNPGAVGETRFYIVTFSDSGERHAVPSSTVDSRGRFTRNGTAYQLTTQRDTGQRFAFPLR